MEFHGLFVVGGRYTSKLGLLPDTEVLGLLGGFSLSCLGVHLVRFDLIKSFKTKPDRIIH